MTRSLILILFLAASVPSSAAAAIPGAAPDGGARGAAASPAAGQGETPGDDDDSDDDQDVQQERHDNEAMKRLSPEQLVQVLKARESRRIATAHHDDPPAVAVLVPFFFFASLLGLVGGTLWFRFRSERLRQETLRLMVEKGTDIPAAFFAPKPRSQEADMRRGVVLVAVGVGIAFFIAIALQQPRMATVGAVPILTGAAYLMVWRLQRRNGSAGE